MIPPSRQLIADFAKMELGTRWLHQGRASRKGLDCLGLIVLTARRCGYDVEDTTNYMANPDSELLIREVTRQFDLIDLEEATTGDVLTFAFTETRRPYHFAIMTSPTTMIHAYGTARKVIEHTIDEYWNGCKVHAFRFPGVTA